MFMIMLLLLLVLSLFVLRQHTLIHGTDIKRKRLLRAFARIVRKSSRRRCRVHYSDVFRLLSNVSTVRRKVFTFLPVFRLARRPQQFPRDQVGYADALLPPCRVVRREKPFVIPPRALSNDPETVIPTVYTYECICARQFARRRNPIRAESTLTGVIVFPVIGPNTTRLSWLRYTSSWSTTAFPAKCFRHARGMFSRSTRESLGSRSHYIRVAIKVQVLTGTFTKIISTTFFFFFLLHYFVLSPLRDW